jgi:Putative prokaryotic signal transducing protein
MSPYRQLTAVPAVIAQIVRGALQVEGIDVVLDRDALGSVYGLDSGEWATRVLVEADQLARARALLDQFEAAEP